MNWEPWTGCYYVSEGCKYCYFYGPYSKRCGQNTVVKTTDFDKPILKTAKNKYKIQSSRPQFFRFGFDIYISLFVI